MKINFKLTKNLIILIQILSLFSFSKQLKTNLRSLTDYPTLTFSEGSITETIEGNGYTISSTTLTITNSGTYILKGSCSECNIDIKKSTTDVTLILNSLILSSSTTAPIVLKKSTSVTIQLEGTSTITDLENIENEENDDFEGAAIKLKSGSNLIIKGSGTLNAIGSSCKNGIKGGATSSIIINSGIINIKAANNGLASDGSIIINDGTINITSDNDGIKSEPDSDDTESEGSIIINGGNIIINSNGDGIQATSSLTINNGVFNIISLSGYSDSTFDSDSMSCKGLKASNNDNEDIVPVLNITGGTFNINSPDDAIHSDGTITITGGTFNIYTGDDGVHAESSLILGNQNGSDNDLSITIKYSYEGLEGSTITIYSGTYNIYSTNDGINAAGGNSNNNNNSFGPRRLDNTYSIYIYGGNIYVNADGDGLDSNGDIYIYGGNIEVWGMRSGGDNEPLDHDGTLEIYNATLLGGGSRGMKYLHSGISKINQNYIYSTKSISSSESIYIYNEDNEVVYESKTPKVINYLFFTSSDIKSSYSFGTSSGKISTSYGSGNSYDNSDNSIENNNYNDNSSDGNNYSGNSYEGSENDGSSIELNIVDSDSSNDLYIKVSKFLFCLMFIMM